MNPEIKLLSDGRKVWEECTPQATRTETHQEPLGPPEERRVATTGTEDVRPMCRKFQKYQPQRREAKDYLCVQYVAEKKSSLGWNIAIGVGIGLLVVGAIFVTGGLVVGAGGTFLGASGGATGAAVAGGAASATIGGGIITIGQLGKPTGENHSDYTRGIETGRYPKTEYSNWVNNGAIYEQAITPLYPCP